MTILFTNFDSVVVSGTTTRTNVVSYSIPANLVADTRALRITSTYTIAQGTGSNPRSIYLHGAFDSSDEIFLLPQIESGSLFMKHVSTIYPKTSTSQKILSEAAANAWADDDASDDSRGSYVVDNRDTTIDMTEEVQFELDAELQTAHSSFFLIRDGVIVELI